MSQWGEQRGRVSSLSSHGCYITGRTAPAVGTDVPDILITLPTGAITVHGTVVDATPGIGFGVRFTDLDREAATRLNDLVRGLDPAAAATADRTGAARHGA